MSPEEQAALLKQEWLDRQSKCIDWYLGKCESRIERLFMLAALSEDCGFVLGPCRQEDFYAIHACGAGIPFASNDDHYGRVWAVLQPTVSVGDRVIRPNFAFTCDAFRIAVELDGHEVTERTKLQAARDKSRDRSLTLAGWIVMRFTGSDVYADPAACVNQIREFFSLREEEHYLAALASFRKQDE